MSSSSEESSWLHSVALAEFDIDKGSCLRASYPVTPAVSACYEEWGNYLTEQMLPDGSEHHDNLKTVVILDRPDNVPTTRCAVYAFEAAGSSEGVWSRIGSHVSNSVVRQNARSVACEVLSLCGGRISIRSTTSPQPLFEAGVDTCQLFPHPDIPEEVLLAAGLIEKKPENAEHDETDSAGKAQLEENEINRRRHQRNPSELFAEGEHGFAVLSRTNANLKMIGLLFQNVQDISAMTSRLAICRKQMRSSRFVDPARSHNVALYGIVCLETKRDTTARRGGITKAICLCGTELPFLFSVTPMVEATVQWCCNIKGSDADAIENQRHELASLFYALQKIAAEPCKLTIKSNPQQVRLRLHGLCDQSKSLCKVSSALAEKSFKLEFPCSVPLADCTGFNHSISVARLVERLQHHFVVVLAAAVMDKRIVFLSRTLSAGEVSDTVMAFGAALSAVFPHFITRRVFPYTSINCMELFLSVPGFVAGTLNPMFESHQGEWCDVLVDMDANAVSTSPEMQAILFPEGAKEQDEEFAARLLDKMMFMRGLNVSELEVEMMVRDMVTERLMLLLCCIATPEKVPSSLRSASLRTHMARLRSLQLSDLYDDWKMSGVPLQAFCAEWFLGVYQLREVDNLEEFQILQCLQDIVHALQTEETTTALLARFPAGLGGLLPLASYLLHPSKAVRLLAIAILRRVDATPVGKEFISSLNSFALFAYDQAKLELPDTSSVFLRGTPPPASCSASPPSVAVAQSAP